MKKILFLVVILFLTGVGCSSQNQFFKEDNQQIIEKQQQQIEDLYKKLNEVTDNSTSTSKVEEVVEPIIQTKIIERIVQVKDQTQIKDIQDLKEKIQDLESKPKTNIDIQGNSNINYNQFITNIVQIHCDNGSGSGTIVSPYTILTNYHVIEGATYCLVGFTTDHKNLPSEWEKSTIVSVDKNLDRAVLRVENEQLANKTIKKCNVSDTAISDNLVTMGYPGAGGKTLTITDGIISGFENGYIKTSAKINPGNSGGAAIHKSGCYLGIPTSVNISGFDPIGHIIDERIGEKQNNNDANMVSAEELNNQIKAEQRTKYLEFDNILKSVGGTGTFLAEAKRANDAGDYLLAAAEYKKEKIRLQAFANKLLTIKSFEGFEEIEEFKTNYYNYFIGTATGYGYMEIAMKSRDEEDVWSAKYYTGLAIDSLNEANIFLNKAINLISLIEQKSKDLFK